MPVSDKPRKPRSTQRPRATKATSAADWKKAESQLPLIETPTGKWIRMKRPGMTKFLEAGFLPDALAAVVRKEINSAARKKVDPQKLLESVDGDAAVEMLEAMDRIVISVMVEPKFTSHRRQKRNDDDELLWLPDGKPHMEDIPEDERRADIVYTDEMDQDDKNFVFRVAVGGSTDLTRFRAEQAAVVDAVSAITNVAEAPESDPAPGP